MDDDFINPRTKRQEKKQKNLEKKRLKEKYSQAFEQYWCYKKSEYEIHASIKYEDANPLDVNNIEYCEMKKKEAVTKALENFDLKKEEAFLQFIDEKECDAQILSDMYGSPSEEKINVMKPESNKVDFAHKSIYTCLEDD